MGNVFKLGMALLCMICYSVNISAQVNLHEKVVFYGKLDKKTNLPKKSRGTKMVVVTGFGYKETEFQLDYYEAKEIPEQTKLDNTHRSHGLLINDVIKGDFKDDVVSNAVLSFPSGWKFYGTLRFEIDNAKNQIAYHFIEGKIVPRFLEMSGDFGCESALDPDPDRVFSKKDWTSKWTYNIEAGADAYIIRGFDGRLEFSDSILKFYGKRVENRIDKYERWLLGGPQPAKKFTYYSIKFNEKFPQAIWNIEISGRYTITDEGIIIKGDSIIWPNDDYLVEKYISLSLCHITCDDGSIITKMKRDEHSTDSNPKYLCSEVILVNGDTLRATYSDSYIPLLGDGDIHHRKVPALSDMPDKNNVDFKVYPKGGGHVLTYYHGKDADARDARIEAARKEWQKKLAGLKKKYGNDIDLIENFQIKAGMSYKAIVEYRDFYYKAKGFYPYELLSNGALWEGGGHIKIRNVEYRFWTFTVYNNKVSVVNRKGIDSLFR